MKEHSKKCAMNSNVGIPSAQKDETHCDCDGYHTFDELYAHRIALFIALCQQLLNRNIVCEELGEDRVVIWRSKKHSDGGSYDGWFIMGINTEKGKQISYHLPMSKWDETAFAHELETAPEWDGHTPDDVLNRLKNI